MKIAFGVIVFNSDFVLKECIQSLLDSKVGDVFVVEGPVQYWQDKGFTTSTDDTNKILHSFEQPVYVKHGVWSGKKEMQNELLNMMFHVADYDYFFEVDADEVYDVGTLKQIKKLLEEREPSKVAVPSKTFAGLDRIITEFEEQPNLYWRIFRVAKGCFFSTHRPPTIFPTMNGEVIPSTTLEKMNLFMYHFSYSSPKMVYEKMEYYRDKVNPQNIIEDYCVKVFLPWLMSWNAGDKEGMQAIEDLYGGIHEFKHRLPAYTKPFSGQYPRRIKENLKVLKKKIKKDLDFMLEGC